MKVDGSDWNKVKVKEKSESEILFDSMLFYRQSASLLVERLRIIKELERLLPEDQTKFAECLSDAIFMCESECTLDIDDFRPRPESLDEIYYDKNTPLVEHLNIKRKLIFEYLQEIKLLWHNKQVNEIAARLKETHRNDLSEILKIKVKIEQAFSLLENLTIAAIKDSSDKQKNEKLEKSLEEMRNDFINNGFNV
ncbi:MAG: hypothetical protein LBD48_11740 [Treponema sp.]|jgi:hypothetical protein|nr:hypothetical protein [Treponema sp.]